MSEKILSCWMDTLPKDVLRIVLGYLVHNPLSPSLDDCQTILSACLVCKRFRDIVKVENYRMHRTCVLRRAFLLVTLCLLSERRTADAFAPPLLTRTISSRQYHGRRHEASVVRVPLSWMQTSVDGDGEKQQQLQKETSPTGNQHVGFSRMFGVFAAASVLSMNLAGPSSATAATNVPTNSDRVSGQSASVGESEVGMGMFLVRFIL